MCGLLTWISSCTPSMLGLQSMWRRGDRPQLQPPTWFGHCHLAGLQQRHKQNIRHDTSLISVQHSNMDAFKQREGKSHYVPGMH